MKIINKRTTGNWVTICIEVKMFWIKKHHFYSGSMTEKGNIFLWVSEPDKKRVSPEMELKLCDLLKEYKN